MPRLGPAQRARGGRGAQRAGLGAACGGASSCGCGCGDGRAFGAVCISRCSVLAPHRGSDGRSLRDGGRAYRCVRVGQGVVLKTVSQSWYGACGVVPVRWGVWHKDKVGVASSAGRATDIHVLGCVADGLRQSCWGGQ